MQGIGQAIGAAMEGLMFLSLILIFTGLPCIIYCEYLLFNYFGWSKWVLLNIAWFGIPIGIFYWIK